MADISALGQLQPVEPLDLENYADNREFGGATLPAKGRYTVRAPDAFPPAAFTRTRKGDLSATVDPTIVGPSNEGYNIRFTKVSAKPFKRGGVTVSQMGDYLRAAGVRGKFSDEAALADAIEQTANAIYEIDVDWRAYNKNTGFSVEGMERFPSDGNGGHLPWFPDPQEKQKDENGELVLGADGQPQALRLRANLTVARYVPAS